MQLSRWTIATLAAAAAACGQAGHVAGPDVPTPPSAAVGSPSTLAAVPRTSLPATYDRTLVQAAAPDLDPEYLHALLYSVVTNTAVDGPDRPLQLWPAGVPMRHCYGEGIPQDVAEAAAVAIADATRIPRTSSGPCTVEWRIDETISGSGYCSTLAPGHVVLVFHLPRTLAWSALHELGHAVGLGHSPHRGDLMYYQALDLDAFSPDELEVLRLMYPR